MMMPGRFGSALTEAVFSGISTTKRPKGTQMNTDKKVPKVKNRALSPLTPNSELVWTRMNADKHGWYVTDEHARLGSLFDF